MDAFCFDLKLTIFSFYKIALMLELGILFAFSHYKYFGFFPPEWFCFNMIYYKVKYKQQRIMGIKNRHREINIGDKEAKKRIH